jgi:hypothetical protein
MKNLIPCSGLHFCLVSTQLALHPHNIRIGWIAVMRFQLRLFLYFLL